MKKLMIILLLLCFAISIPVVYGDDVITLRLGHFAAEDSPQQAGALMFAKAVDERTHGKIKIVIYPNNALGSPPQVLEQCVMGAVDMALPTQGQLGVYVKKFNTVMLPFAFPSYEIADKVLDGAKFQKWTNPELEAKGLVFLSNWEWGFRNLTTSKKPVRVPEDAKGLKIRTPPELPTQAAMEALGCTVATINFNELIVALNSGVVDGEENPIAVIYSLKLWESQKYITMTGHNYNTMVSVINKKVWDKLSWAQQQIIKQESQKAGTWVRKKMRTDEASQMKEMQAKDGVEIIWPDKAKFQALMKPAYARLAVTTGQDNIDYFLKIVKEAEASK